MTKIIWKKDYETGIDRIDIQHRNLVNILNTIIEIPVLTAAQKHQVMELNLEALVDYTVFHFEVEEAFMLNSKYPKFAEHKKEHESLKATALNYLGRFKKGEPDLENPIIDFLKNWLINHIGKSDMDYVPFVMKYEKEQAS